ncbi:DUF3108 domain-containing protein [Engelhardtia mirabilis]|uniref:DUF3108 domain-containing protein n=1 Tax=Engelhardtia mirabilis TaxID=2528011 RepID=A0A518BIV6_9BACT|nr:hypothetical protein Pla133_19960 [Planctomycetes bacterium Pla133]QDV01247.1 hypothetical protein Pla86_19960 [Planctomycetes bacterium Pla86]
MKMQRTTASAVQSLNPLEAALLFGALLFGVPASALGDDQATADGFVIDRGAESAPLSIPRNEVLHYDVRVETALININAGTVELSSGVELKRPSLLGNRSAGGAEVGWVKAHAYGDYSLYVMDATIHTRFQHDAWPRMIHSYRHEGTEKRRREILTGVKGDAWMASYRSDTKTGAPQGTRIWRPADEFSVPADAVDTLGAVYLVRHALARGERNLIFHMLDNQRIWNVEARFGELEVVETGAGRFEARRVDLITHEVAKEDMGLPPISEADREAASTDDEESSGSGKFEGPFGLRGEIVLWMENRTGIPLVIHGSMPMLLGEIEVDIRLSSTEGAPAQFVPLASDED